MGKNKTINNVQEQLLAIKDKPKELFSGLYRILREEFQQENKTLSELIVKLNKEDNIDFCQLAVDAMNDNFRCFDVAPVLEDTLSEMDLNISSVLCLIERLFEGMQGDMMAYRQFKPFEGLVTKQPEFSKNLLSELLNKDKPYVVGYISRFYQTFSKGHEHETHKELCSLKDHESKYVLMAVADALGELDYKPSKNRKLIKQTLSVLDELEEKNFDEVNRLAIFAYMNLLKLSKEPKNRLIKFSKSDKIIIQGAISEVLFRSQEEHGNEKWFSEALLNLSRASCKNKGIMDNIDYVLSGLVKKYDNWNLAERFIVEWIVNSDYYSNNEKLSELFNSTFTTFINRRTNFEELLTRFFNHDNFILHNAAAEITSYCQLHKISGLKLNKQILKTLSYVDCLYICRKILGYVIYPEYLCSLCFSILDTFPKKKDIQSLTYTIFSSHIGENYPGRTLDFLKKVTSETKSINKRKIAAQIVEDIENYSACRDALPKLNELIPAKQKALRIFRESNKKISAAMEEAQKNSIVSMIASKSTLKQGTGWFHYMHGQYSEISKLGKYSTQAEIPHSEVTHPVDAAIERVGFRQAKRGEP